MKLSFYSLRLGRRYSNNIRVSAAFSPFLQINCVKYQNMIRYAHEI